MPIPFFFIAMSFVILLDLKEDTEWSRPEIFTDVIKSATLCASGHRHINAHSKPDIILKRPLDSSLQI